MAVHKPGSVWPLRSMQLGAHVRTLDEEKLFLSIPSDPEWRDLIYIAMSRKDARLLARRINACLDATTVKGKS